MIHKDTSLYMQSYYSVSSEIRHGTTYFAWDLTEMCSNIRGAQIFEEEGVYKYSSSEKASNSAERWVRMNFPALVREASHEAVEAEHYRRKVASQ